MVDILGIEICTGSQGNPGHDHKTPSTATTPKEHPTAKRIGVNTSRNPLGNSYGSPYGNRYSSHVNPTNPEGARVKP